MLNLLKRSVLKTTGRRLFSNTQGFDSLVIGAYTETPQLTTHVSNETRNLIQSQLALSNFKKAGDVRVFYDIGGVKQVAVVSLGDKKNTNENDEQESVRSAVSNYLFFKKEEFIYGMYRLLLVFRHFNVKVLPIQVLMFL